MATDSSPLRPTKSVVRKALCDILRPVVKGLVLLDLYAGTGQVSQDLLDEGARQAYAVDTREEPEDLPDGLRWFQQPVRSFLSHGPPEPVGLVFLDPPYEQGDAQPVLRELVKVDWLKEYALVAIETDRDTELEAVEGPESRFQLKRNRRYGGTRLWIFQKELPATGDDGS